jgi:hypothetical protein
VRPVLALDLEGLGGLQAAVAELAEEGQQPLLSGEAGAGVFVSQGLAGRLERGPGGLQAVPASAGGLVRLLPTDEVVGLGGEAVDPLRAFDEALQEVGREEAALGLDAREEAAAGAGHQPALPRSFGPGVAGRRVE